MSSPESSQEKKPEDHIAYRIPGLERPKPTKSDPPSGKRMGIDFIASLAACSIVGALADRAFNSAPWGFLIMLFFGLVIGAVNAWRMFHRGHS